MAKNAEIEKLVSIIIPVYNVEKYLEASVQSVLNQTYTNLEIILIDDGSTDESGNICNQLAEIDSRIHVLHQKNRGLSEARNTGLLHAKGSYLFFIDSDDLVFPWAIEELYENIQYNDADIAIGGTYTSFSKECILPEIEQHNSIINTYDSFNAINEMLYSTKFSTSVWGRLYKAEIFDEIRFPAGKYYEDLFTTYKLFLKANKIIYTDNKSYCYFKRIGSISMETHLSQKQFDCFKALDIIYQDIIQIHPELMPAYRNCYMSFYIRMMQNASKDQIKLLNKIENNVRKYRIKVAMDSKALKRTRAIAVLSFTGKHMTKIIVDKWYKRKGSK